jgi:hypothetical protein
MDFLKDSAPVKGPNRMLSADSMMGKTAFDVGGSTSPIRRNTFSSSISRRVFSIARLQKKIWLSALLSMMIRQSSD